MKILFASDFHFDLRNAGLDRHDEILKAFQIVTDKSRTVDLVVLGGDVFHTPRPSPRAYAAVVELMQQMGSPVAWLTGNHEVQATADALEPFRKMRELRCEIIADPMIRTLNGRRLLFCPYVTDARAAVVSMKAQEWVDAIFLQAMDERVDGAFSHLDADGAVVGSEGHMLRGGRLQMPLDVARKLPCEVVNGHIHKQQTMFPNIVMPGSPIATDAGDREERGYCYVMEV